MHAQMAAQIAAVAASAPMAVEEFLPAPGRHLVIDGDYLAYWAAGNDDTEQFIASRTALDKIDALQSACRAEKVTLVLTGSGSDKGMRYAVATVKPYQEKRHGTKRPKNWGFLRDVLEGHANAEIWYDREADDAIVMHAWDNPDNTVICTKDKDMRVSPGLHLCWDTHTLLEVPVGTYCLEHGGKVYGYKWFLLQMLHGDPADNIPGLPKLDGKLCGPKRAEQYLADTFDHESGIYAVIKAYQGHYDKDWASHFAEQAALLWMRTGRDASPTEWLEHMPALAVPIEDELHIACSELRRRIDHALDAEDCRRMAS